MKKYKFIKSFSCRFLLTCSLIWLFSTVAFIKGQSVPQSGSVYRLRNLCSQKLLTIDPNRTDESAPAFQAGESGGANQQWKVEATDSGYYKLTVQHSARVLDVQYSQTNDGTTVWQWSLNGTNAQQWQIIDQGNGYFKLVSRLAANKVLDVSNASTADGARVQLWIDNGTCAQRWKLEAVSGNPPPPPSVAGFVTRSGSQLLLNGQPFRFAGANIYWLGLDENVGGVNYPTEFRVSNALDTLKEMGGNVVRSHTLAASHCPDKCIRTTRDGALNETALRKVDYAIKAAKDRNLRLIVPLVDGAMNWNIRQPYYHGGALTWVRWRNPSSNDPFEFYSNRDVVNDFKLYISQLLNRVNTLTGVAYKDDPTIMAWETGNELPSPDNDFTRTNAWTQEIADYIKSIDHKHLVIDGRYEWKTGLNNNVLTIASVDIVTNHYYPQDSQNRPVPPDPSLVAADAVKAQNAGKAFYVGEYAWTRGSADELNNFLTAIRNSAAAGDTYWALFGHRDDYGYVQHSDGAESFTLHFPGNTTEMRQRVQLLRNHAFAIRGLGVAAYGTPGKPVITNVTNNTIAWRGVAGADKYTIERSTSGASGAWTIICDRCATDNQTPWTDNSRPGGAVWYRVKAHNLAGVAGAYSDVFAVPAAALIDDLNDWSKTFSHTGNLRFDVGNDSYFEGDNSRAYRATATNEEIVWKLDGIIKFEATTFFWIGEPISPFTIYVSVDGNNWNQAAPIISEGSEVVANWRKYVYTLNNLSNVNYVKMRWNNTNGNFWTPQIGKVVVYK